MRLFPILAALLVIAAIDAFVVERERARKQYGAAEYVLGKMATELPLDAAFAAGFGALLQLRIGLRLPTPVLVGTLAPTAALARACRFDAPWSSRTRSWTSIPRLCISSPR